MQNTEAATLAPAVDPGMLAQHALERDMRSLGIERYRKSVRDSDLSETNPGLALTRSIVGPLTAGIQTFLAEAAAGKGGRRFSAAKHLRQVAPDAAAYLTAKTLLDSATKRLSYLAAAQVVATAIEDEARFRYFERDDAKTFKRVNEKLDKQTRNGTHKKRAMSVIMGRTDLEWAAWTIEEKRTLGFKLIDMAVASSPFVVLTKSKTQGYRVEVTEETLKFIEDRNAACELLAPVMLPCVVPPKPWEGIYGGGYYTQAVPTLPMIKSRVKTYLADMKSIDMPAVYEVMNAIQNTAWRINVPVLKVLEEVWEKGFTTAALPPREDHELPAKPADIATNEESRKQWKRSAAEIYGKNAKGRGRRLQVAKVISVAKTYADKPAMWFPYQMDFRGRVYAVPSFLNPQGPDYAKALLTFANGKPIGDDVAAGWLAIHVANCFGFDKATLEERIAWTEDHGARIESVVNDPLADLWWTEASSPWQFLAACFEWAGFLREGYDFVSSIPIGLDGSCNGIQHFSAMLRDPVGGEAVNLLPSVKPQDIYQKVADLVMVKLRQFTCTCAGDDWAYASQWLDFGVDRKLSKRPVMVLPYGGTLMACRKYVGEYVDDKVDGGADNVFGEAKGKAISWMASLLWKCIGEVVIAARQAMDWLQKAARIVAREQLPIVWRTPTGFVVQQAYRDVERRMVKTLLNGSMVRLVSYDETDQIDENRQALGIAPNFVHSMDASALVLSVGVAVDNGIDSFAMIHDSYGTLAADTAKLGVCLRRAFVDLYQSGDWLAHFRDDLYAMLSDEGRAALDKLPLPAKGDLDIEAVLGSDFFFA